MKKLAIIILILFLVACTLAYAEMAMINSLNTGEVTGQIYGRADVKKYYSACRLLENFVCEPYGGVAKRPGTYYIDEVADSDYTGRLIAFERSTSESFILEFGNETIQIYK
jgi:hypothetical protein